MISIYQLKPRFQALLRPIVGRLAAAGVTANQVTLAAMLISLALGLGLFLNTANSSAFLLLPLWMFLRMAFNAVDGMLAREFGQQSALGAYLNELSDVISDAALYLPFVAIAPFGWGSVGAVIFLSAVSEMAGALGPMVGARASTTAPWARATGPSCSARSACGWASPAACPTGPVDHAGGGLAILLNTINRIRSGVRQARTNPEVSDERPPPGLRTSFRNPRRSAAVLPPLAGLPHAGAPS
jgi:CDP-diacylglycerol--glycerol-3-phosphate 3-phosphatidyltransferase